MPGKRDAANLDEVTQMHESFCAVEGNAESHPCKMGAQGGPRAAKEAAPAGREARVRGALILWRSDLVACQWFRPRVSPSRFTP